MFILGGIMYIFAGVAKTAERGKKMLTSAAIGLIIVLGAYLIVDFVLIGLTQKGIEETTKEYVPTTPTTGVQIQLQPDLATCEKSTDCQSGYCYIANTPAGTPYVCPAGSKCGTCKPAPAATP